MRTAANLRLRTLPGVLVALTFLLGGLLPAPAAAPLSQTEKRAAAKTQFSTAEKLRAGLEGKPQKERSAAEYRSVITAYRRVVSTAPASSDAQAALVAVAELYQEMGRAYGDEYFQKAIDTYQFLLQQYPATRYRSDALFTIAQIQQEDLDQPDAAEKSYDDFLKKYPHSAKAADAQQALKDIAADRERATKSASRKSLAEEHARERRMPQVTGIRHWNAENYTRVVINLEDDVKYQAARIANPDRIYFDLYTAHLSSALAGKTLDVQNGFLKSIRVAQNQAGVVRVVLEVEKVKDYSVFLLKDPYRLVVDVYGDTTVAKAEASSAEPPRAAEKAPKRAEKGAASAKKSGREETAEAEKPSVAAEKSASSGKKPAAKNAKPPAPADKPASGEADVASNETPSEDVGSDGARRGAETKSEPDGDKPGGARPGETPTVPQPNHKGEHSLTRTLGLKIGKIVIDAGHGGHDTGTIGPTGLAEKDLTLDVALRLGKLVHEKLGAQVIYTRSDDTFVPLEDRTAIANQARADLFISIHANSSRDHSARGTETYYLNLTDSEEAREVAARENALAQASIHDLQDLVQKIARNEKIDESRELATDIQQSLAKRMQRGAKPPRNRGVKRAPFIVLLGANMPSVLTEISFLSNPTDEAMLKKNEQRQRVAEGLLAGITNYLESLGSVSHTIARLAAQAN
jgi:N-acetylmuramoyl-L-alanine amidase